MNKKKKLRKAIFDKYVINLRGKTYEVYETSTPIEGLAVCDDYDYGYIAICGPDYYWVWIKHISILLKHNPNALVYVHSANGDRCIELGWYEYAGVSKVLFYRPEANLHKTDWFDIVKCIKYTKREKFALKYDLDYEKKEFASFCKKFECIETDEYGKEWLWIPEWIFKDNYTYGWYNKISQRRKIIRNTVFVCEPKIYWMWIYYKILHFNTEHGDLGWNLSDMRCVPTNKKESLEFDPEDCIEELRASAKQKKKLKKEQKRLRYKKKLAKMLPKQD